MFVIHQFIPITQDNHYYSYSRILCGKGYCMDLLVECEGRRIINISIETPPERFNRTFFSSLGWCERN